MVGSGYDEHENPPPGVPKGWEPPELDNTLPNKDIEEMIREYPKSALTGIWVPDERVVYMDPRRVRHHNDQLSVLRQTDRLPDSFIPFLWSTFTMGDSTRAEFDMPRSAGGAFQFVNRADEDIEYISAGMDTTPGDIYAGVYACRVWGAPGDSDASIEYLPPDIPDDLPPEILNEFKTKRQQFTLEQLYKELSFTGHLPDPILAKGLDDDQGVVTE
jgi:hypothetical protein